MTRALLVLTRLRLLDVLRNRSSIGFLLGFPLVLLLVIGLVFSGGHPFERRALLVVGDAAAAARVAEALVDLDELRVEPAAGLREAEGRLRARMAAAVLVQAAPEAEGPFAGLRTWRLLVGPRDQLFGRGLEQRLLALPARLEVLDVPRGGYVHYLFPGILVFSVMVSGLFATGHTMVLYRQNGFLKKLATTPLPKAAFVAAQIAARSLVVLVQVLLLLAVARLAFDVPIALASLGWLLAAVVLGLLAFMGIGFALACVVRSDELVVDVISAVQMPLVLLSEMFFPLASLPGALRVAGEVLPSTVLVRTVRAVLLWGESDPAALLPGLAVLAGWAAVSFVVSLAVFEWHE